MDAVTNVITLLSNAAATGSAFRWPGGRGTFSVVATFGGGTVKLQFLGPDGTTWLDAGAYTTLTANGAGNFDLPPCSIRANVATATAVFATATAFGM